jgi:hypothetical protein
MSQVRRRGVAISAAAAACSLLLTLVAVDPPRAQATPPANDNFANAQVVGPAVPVAVATTNVEATAEAGEPDRFFNPAQHSVWFSWTAPANMTAVVDVCDHDAAIDFTIEAVYTGAAVNALTEVRSTAGECVLRFNAISGQNYKVAIDTGDDAGTFTFRLRQLTPPANDAFLNAEVVAPSLPITLSRSTVDATTEMNEPAGHGGSDGRSVWFKWTPTSGGPVRLDFCDFDTRSGAGNAGIFVYTGPGTLAGLVPVTSTSLCKMTFTAVSATTYWIAFSPTIRGEGTFTLKMLQATPPANDNFASRLSVGPGLPVSLVDDNLFATVEGGEPVHGAIDDSSFENHDSVWYTWTPSSTGEARISVCNASVPTRVGVYTGSPVTNLVRVTSTVPITSQPFCSLRWNAVAGTQYQIAVGDNQEDNEGTFTLDIHRFTPPSNDDFANAQTLSPALPINAAGSNIDAVAQTGEPNHGPDFGPEASVWYRWTPSVSEPVSIDTCASDFDALIGVHTGSALNQLPRVATSEGGPGCGGPFGGKTTLNAVAGTTYYIAVDGSDEGHFTLALRSLSASVVVTPPAPGFNLKAALKKCKKKFPKGKKRTKCIKKAKKRAKREAQSARVSSAPSA